MTEDHSFTASRRKKAWTFIWLNVLAIAGTLALFFGVLYADFSSGFFATSWTWLTNHQVILVLAAASPFVAALLVGRASSAKAKRKRLAEARLRADQEASEARARRAAERGAGD